MRRPTQWTDKMLLDALTMVDSGMVRREIAEAMGVSKNSLIGVLNRVEKETDAADVTPRLNGTLPVEWWRDGLRARRGTGQ